MNATRTLLPDARLGPEIRLATGTCLGFGVGTVGVSIMLNAVTAYFPAFMATELGQSPAITGYLLMASKLYDAFADLTIGRLSDRAVIPIVMFLANGVFLYFDDLDERKLRDA